VARCAEFWLPNCLLGSYHNLLTTHDLSPLSLPLLLLLLQYTPLLPAVAVGTMEERSIVEPVRNLVLGKVGAGGEQATGQPLLPVCGGAATLADTYLRRTSALASWHTHRRWLQTCVGCLIIDICVQDALSV
jgi:hypothetical protein